MLPTQKPHPYPYLGCPAADRRKILQEDQLQLEVPAGCSVPHSTRTPVPGACKLPVEFTDLPPPAEDIISVEGLDEGRRRLQTGSKIATIYQVSNMFSKGWFMAAGTCQWILLLREDRSCSASPRVLDA